MQKPFDLNAIDALMLRSIKSLKDNGVGNADDEHAEFYDASFAAGVILTDSERGFRKHGTSGGLFVQAGFKFAMRLCSKIIAEPLGHIDIEELKHDWSEARELVDAGYQWIDEADKRPGRKREVQPTG